MSQPIEKQKCPVCHAYFFEDEDIVYCPDCGAPHHRDCYQHLDHCAYQDAHGTADQYVPPAPSEEKTSFHENNAASSADRLCSVCGESMPQDAKICPHCGAPQFGGFAGISPFDFLGGVPADMDLGDGVTADEAKNFVASNTRRYIPKFATMMTGRRLSWTWLAFFFPSAWLLARKMYKSGIVIAALSIVFNLFTFPLSQALLQYDVSEAKNYTELSQKILEHLPQISTVVLVAGLIGSFLQIALRIGTALLGDWTYRNYTLSSVNRLKKESDDLTDDFQRYGGINLIAMVLGIVAERYLPTFITLFL